MIKYDPDAIDTANIFVVCGWYGSINACYIYGKSDNYKKAE